MEIQVDGKKKDGANDAVHYNNNELLVAYIVAGGQYDDTLTSLSENQVGSIRMTPNRATHSNLRNNAGTEVGTASDPVRIDPTGDTTQPVSAASLPLPTGAATAAKQLSDGHYVMGGNANIATKRENYTTAQTDTAMVSAPPGVKIVVTRISVTLDNACSVDVQCRIGFGLTTTPTGTGVLLSHPGIAAGSGVVEGNGSGILGIGADGEDLRITCEVPTGGSLDVVYSYYFI